MKFSCYIANFLDAKPLACGVGGGSALVGEPEYLTATGLARFTDPRKLHVTII